MPGPVSMTSIRRVDCEGVVSVVTVLTDTVTDLVSDFAVNLRAFDSKFLSICLSLFSSARIDNELSKMSSENSKSRFIVASLACRVITR